MHHWPNGLVRKDFVVHLFLYKSEKVGKTGHVDASFWKCVIDVRPLGVSLFERGLRCIMSSRRGLAVFFEKALQTDITAYF